MSDDKTPAEAEPKASDEPKEEPTPKAETVSKEEFNKVVAQRDKLKKESRKVEEQKAKDEEAKALERGEHEKIIGKQNEELEVLRANQAKRDEADAEARKNLLSKLGDGDPKKVGEAISDLEVLRTYVNATNAEPPINTPKGGSTDKSKDTLQPMKGESPTAYSQRMAQHMGWSGGKAKE